MATVFVRAETPNRERCLPRKGTEQCHGILCRRLTQLSCICREETAPNVGIVEILPSYSAEQSSARRYKRKPKVEIPITLPPAAGHPARWPPSGADSQTFATFPRLANLKCV
jgi:hypothetical protein